MALTFGNMFRIFCIVVAVQFSNAFYGSRGPLFQLWLSASLLNFWCGCSQMLDSFNIRLLISNSNVLNEQARYIHPLRVSQYRGRSPTILELHIVTYVVGTN
jgi:hypothetical protein